MRIFRNLSLLLAAFFFLASGIQAHAHHGGDHPAWEIDEFDDGAFKVAPAIWVGTAAGVLLCAGAVVALKRPAAQQARTSRTRRG